MEYRIQHAPVFTVIEFALNEAEVIVAQPDSMISMTAGIHISGTVSQAGSSQKWWSGFKSLLGGESFFRAVFRAKRDGQTLLLAPSNYGDIVPLSLLECGGTYLTRGAYLAHHGDCTLEVKYGGVKGMMARTGLFLLHASGSGAVFLQTYGSIVERLLAEEENFFIDNRYLVAFSETVTYQVVKSSKSISDSLMSGEAFVNKFTGPGKVYYQTRTKPSPGFLSQLFAAVT